VKDAGTWDILDRAHGSRVLVALPGAMGNADVFEPLFAALPAGIRAIAVSPPAIPDARELAALLVALLRERGVERMTLLGTSFGGYVAQFAALLAPDLIEMLVLANTFSDPALNPKRRDPADVNAEDADAMHAAAAERVRSGPPTATRDALLAQLAEQSPQTFKARALALARGGAVPAVPVAVDRIGIIDTADDPVIAPPLRADLLARYAGARHVTLASGGHYPYLADPAGYAAALAEVTSSWVPS
jgi:pimeloyl-ACP methyl ester carboxylesterase